MAADVHQVLCRCLAWYLQRSSPSSSVFGLWTSEMRREVRTSSSCRGRALFLIGLVLLPLATSQLLGGLLGSLTISLSQTINSAINIAALRYTRLLIDASRNV